MSHKLGCFTLSPMFAPRSERTIEEVKTLIQPRKTRSDKGSRRIKQHDPVLALLHMSEDEYGTSLGTEHRAAQALRRLDRVIADTKNEPRWKRNQAIGEELRDILYRERITGQCARCGCIEVNDIRCTCSRFR